MRDGGPDGHSRGADPGPGRRPAKPAAVPAAARVRAGRAARGPGVTRGACAALLAAVLLAGLAPARGAGAERGAAGPAAQGATDVDASAPGTVRAGAAGRGAPDADAPGPDSRPSGAAESGAAGADFAAAQALLERGDAARARGLLARLSLDGDPRAQRALARMLVAGVGGPADREEAMGWFCVLAHQPSGGRDVVQALWLLAEYFRTGGALPGFRYGEGRRDRENPLRAHFWFTLLATQDRHYEQVVEDAARLGALGMRSTGRELREGERERVARRAAGWQPLPDPAPPARERCLSLPD